MLVIMFLIRVCVLNEMVSFNVLVFVSSGVMFILIFESRIIIVMVLIIIVSVL